MLRREGLQRQGRPLLHARVRAAREGEALHVRAVGAGEARRPADTGDRVDDQSDHDATGSAWKRRPVPAEGYFRWYARHVIAHRSGSSRSSWCV